MICSGDNNITGSRDSLFSRSFTIISLLLFSFGKIRKALIERWIMIDGIRMKIGCFGVMLLLAWEKYTHFDMISVE